MTPQQFYGWSSYVLSFFWMACFARFCIIFPLVGITFLAGGIADFFIGIHSLYILEFVNTLLIQQGKVTVHTAFMPKSTTLMVLDILKRCIVVGVIFNFPKTAKSTPFALLVFCQSAGEFTRFADMGFHSTRRSLGSPHWIYKLVNLITWPLKELSDMALLFMSLKYPHQRWSAIGVKMLLVAYIPWFYLHYRNIFTNKVKTG